MSELADIDDGFHDEMIGDLVTKFSPGNKAGLVSALTAEFSLSKDKVLECLKSAGNNAMAAEIMMKGGGVPTRFGGTGDDKDNKSGLSELAEIDDGFHDEMIRDLVTKFSPGNKAGLISALMAEFSLSKDKVFDCLRAAGNNAMAAEVMMNGGGVPKRLGGTGDNQD